MYRFPFSLLEMTVGKKLERETEKKLWEDKEIIFLYFHLLVKYLNLTF